MTDMSKILIRVAEAAMAVEVGKTYEKIPTAEGKFNAITMLAIDFAFNYIKDGCVDEYLESLCADVRKAVKDPKLQKMMADRNAAEAKARAAEADDDTADVEELIAELKAQLVKKAKKAAKEARND